ncbi:hypothetical protein TNCV_3270831, partial [Trichonephila clavipes]
IKSLLPNPCRFSNNHKSANGLRHSCRERKHLDLICQINPDEKSSMGFSDQVFKRSLAKVGLSAAKLELNHHIYRDDVKKNRKILTERSRGPSPSAPCGSTCSDLMDSLSPGTRRGSRILILLISNPSYPRVPKPACNTLQEKEALPLKSTHDNAHAYIIVYLLDTCRWLHTSPSGGVPLRGSSLLGEYGFDALRKAPADLFLLPRGLLSLIVLSLTRMFARGRSENGKVWSLGSVMPFGPCFPGTGRRGVGIAVSAPRGGLRDLHPEPVTLYPVPPLEVVPCLTHVRQIMAASPC